jgi:hypothetical protein
LDCNENLGKYLFSVTNLKTAWRIKHMPLPKTLL